MSAAKSQEPSQFYAELIKGVWRENPIFVVVLGMCPTLAVTNTLYNGFMMGACTFFVLVPSSFLIALLRKFIPSQVRISTFIVIIATFVTMVDFAVQAISLELHKALGAFISLIVVNCIILGRAEAFAYVNTVRLAVADAIGMSLGFWLALLMMSSTREILGYGTLLDGTPWKVHLFGSHYEPWAVMILPPGGFFMLGIILLVFAAMKQRRLRLTAALRAERAAEEGRAD